MKFRPWLAVAFALGLLVGAGAAVLALPRDKPSPPKIAAPPPVLEADDDTMAANAALAASLQECNQKLARAGGQQVPVPSAAPAASGQGRRFEPRPPPSAGDWARFAESGVVPYRIPCLRDTPFVPSERQLDRLGLAPQDADAIKQAYAKSNERMTAQIRPLCAAVLGSPEAADRVGASACVKAITDAARRESPDKMKEALTRVAEVNAGKRSAPDKPAAVEALLLSMTAEARTFEADLAAKIGPDDARLVAGSWGLCQEMGFVSSTQGGPGGGRGSR